MWPNSGPTRHLRPYPADAVSWENSDMKFIVCTDGSERSIGIIPHAARLANAIGAEIVLSRVLDPRTDAADVVKPNLDEAVAEVQTAWEQNLRDILASHGVQGSVVVPHREWGKDVADAIHKAADEQGAALVAMTSRGTGALRHAVLGSVALDVITRADLPVMTAGGTVEPPRSEGDYHLVVTSDGSPDSRSVFAGLAAIVAPGKVRVTLLEVLEQRPTEPNEPAEDRCRAYLQSLLSRLPAGVTSAVEVRSVPPGAGIDTAISVAAKELGADAIAMATHGSSARRHLVAGSTALNVVANGTVPVILVKSRAVD